MRYLDPEDNLTFNSGLCRSVEYSTNVIKHNKTLKKNSYVQKEL